MKVRIDKAFARDQLWPYAIPAGMVLCAALTGPFLAPGEGRAFLVLLLLSVLVSPLKTSLPGVASGLAMNYIFILAAISQLSLLPALLITAASTLCEAFWKSKKPPIVRLAVQGGSTLVGAVIAWVVCHAGPLGHPGASIPLQCFSAALSLFVIQTTASATLDSGARWEKTFAIWQKAYLGLAPQYLVGATVAALFRALSGHAAGYQ